MAFPACPNWQRPPDRRPSAAHPWVETASLRENNPAGGPALTRVARTHLYQLYTSWPDRCASADVGWHVWPPNWLRSSAALLKSPSIWHRHESLPRRRLPTLPSKRPFKSAPSPFAHKLRWDGSWGPLYPPGRAAAAPRPAGRSAPW